MDFWKRKGVDKVLELQADRYDRRVAGRAMRDYLATVPPAERVDVLMCENDILAIGALDVARSEFCLGIPSEMAVLGYDDIDLAGMDSFSLTTYRQPFEEMVDALVKMLTGQRNPETLRLPGELVIRRTA